MLLRGQAITLLRVFSHSVHINIAPFSSALAFVINVSSLWLVSQATALCPKLSASHMLHMPGSLSDWCAQLSSSENGQPDLNSQLGGMTCLVFPNASSKWTLGFVCFL